MIVNTSLFYKFTFIFIILARVTFGQDSLSLNAEVDNSSLLKGDVVYLKWTLRNDSDHDVEVHQIDPKYAFHVFAVDGKNWRRLWMSDNGMSETPQRIVLAPHQTDAITVMLSPCDTLPVEVIKRVDELKPGDMRFQTYISGASVSVQFPDNLDQPVGNVLGVVGRYTDRPKHFLFSMSVFNVGVDAIAERSLKSYARFRLEGEEETLPNFVHGNRVCPTAFGLRVKPEFDRVAHIDQLLEGIHTRSCLFRVLTLVKLVDAWISGTKEAGRDADKKIREILKTCRPIEREYLVKRISTLITLNTGHIPQF